MRKLLAETTVSEFLETIGELRTMFEAGDAKAGYALCVYIDPYNEVIPLSWRQLVGASEHEYQLVCIKTFGLLEIAAENGDGESMHLLAQYYQTGTPPVRQDMESFRSWCQRAVAAGYSFARYDLCSLYADPSSYSIELDRDRYDSQRAE